MDTIRQKVSPRKNSRQNSVMTKLILLLSLFLPYLANSQLQIYNPKELAHKIHNKKGFLDASLASFGQVNHGSSIVSPKTTISCLTSIFIYSLAKYSFRFPTKMAACPSLWICSQRRRNKHFSSIKLHLSCLLSCYREGPVRLSRKLEMSSGWGHRWRLLLISQRRNLKCL